MDFAALFGAGPAAFSGVGSGVDGILPSLILSWVLSQAIGFVYASTFRGLSYQRSFAQALVVGGIVAAMLMLAIGNSLVRGIGIVGTLALIRFRTNLRDPLDMVFIFASFGAGIACGTGNALVGVVGTLVFLVVVAGLRLTGFGGQQPFEGVVRLRLPANDGGAAVLAVLQQHCQRTSLITLRSLGQGERLEAIYQVDLKETGGVGEASLIAALQALPGADGVSLSMQERTVEL